MAKNKLKSSTQQQMERRKKKSWQSQFDWQVISAVQKHHSNELSETMETNKIKDYNTESDTLSVKWLLSIWVYRTQQCFHKADNTA